ncbi:MAG TPA: SCO family protein [Chthoniobacterales bacterium]|nr:SCO family protein [Chthoniobacterales bacterium]
MSSQILGRDSARPSIFGLPRASIAPLFLLTTAAISLAADLPRDPDYDYDPPGPGSYTLPVVKAAADGALLESDGKSLNLRDLTHGRVTVLSFIYTRCAAGKACPYATGVLNQLHLLSADDQSLAKNMRLVSMSFDPDYDTPQRLASYSEAIRETKSGCEWRFATAKSRAELESILVAYGQTVDKRLNPADPQGPLYHILRVFLIDRDGRIRNIYSSGTLDPRLVLADVKTLLLEEAKFRNNKPVPWRSDRIDCIEDMPNSGSLDGPNE